WAAAHVQLAEACARTGAWQEAADSLKRGLELDPGDVSHWYLCGLLYAHAGDAPAYRKACREMIERFGKTTDPDVAARIVQLCVLLPDTVPDRETIQALADRGLTSKKSTGFSRLMKALADYRAGRDDAALEHLSRFPARTDGASFDAVVLLVRAMAYR